MIDGMMVDVRIDPVVDRFHSGWTEVRIKRGELLTDFYAWLKEQRWADWPLCHHFWDEPWWPDGWVVRIPQRINVDGCPHADHAVEWDSRPDEERYGEDWTWMQRYFAAVSQLTLTAPADAEQKLARLNKMVHCLLNAHGLSYREESEYHTRAASERLKMAEAVEKACKPAKRRRWWSR